MMRKKRTFRKASAVLLENKLKEEGALFMLLQISRRHRRRRWAFNYRAKPAV